jgi:hypothetical protein
MRFALRRQSNLVFIAMMILVVNFNFPTSKAASRMGAAIVNDQEGYPCFSIPLEVETKNGIPLDGIVVAEARLIDNDAPPSERWHFMAIDPANRILLRPDACILYGKAPPNTKQRTLKPLEHFTIYRVSVLARTAISNTVAYSAKFCVTPDKFGNPVIHAIPDDERKGNKRFVACQRPAGSN